MEATNAQSRGPHTRAGTAASVCPASCQRIWYPPRRAGYQCPPPPPAPPAPPLPIAEDARSGHSDGEEAAEAFKVPHCSVENTRSPPSCGPRSSFSSPPASNTAPVLWGGMRAGHLLPASARKCAGVDCGDALRGTTKPTTPTTILAVVLDASSISQAPPPPCARPATQRHQPAPDSIDNSIHDARDSASAEWTQCAREVEIDTTEDLDSRYEDETESRSPPPCDAASLIEAIELPVVPLRPSLHQLHVGGPGSYTTLFVKHVPVSITTGIHLHPFLPPKGILRISVKRVHGQNSAFVQYATSDDAFHALLWFYECAFQRVVSSEPPPPPPPPSPITTINAVCVTGCAPPPPPCPPTGRLTQTSRSRAGDSTDLATDGPGRCHKPSSRPLSGPHCVHSATPLHGPALCEAAASLTSGATVLLHNRYSLPMPYSVRAERLAQEGSEVTTRLGRMQEMMGVLSAEWANKTKGGRLKTGAAPAQLQDYCAVLPCPPARAEQPLQPPLPPPPAVPQCDTDMHEDTGPYSSSPDDASAVACTVFIRVRRDYTALYCDGGDGCQRQRQMASGAGEWLVVSGQRAAVPPSRQSPPSPAPSDAGSYKLCGCRLHDASLLDRSEFVLLARLLRAPFFSGTFAGMRSFRSFLEAPFRGGCFVRFRTAAMARDCADWFWQQPHLIAVVDVQMARQDTVKQ